jgi:hypothetical protein
MGTFWSPNIMRNLRVWNRPHATLGSRHHGCMQSRFDLPYNLPNTELYVQMLLVCHLEQVLLHAYTRIDIVWSARILTREHTGADLTHFLLKRRKCSRIAGQLSIVCSTRLWLSGVWLTWCAFARNRNHHVRIRKWESQPSRGSR